MSSSGASTDTSMETPKVGTIDMKLEVVTIPVSDVDRAKRSTRALGGGWTLTSSFATSEGSS